ncbi:MAG TPA: hypothetical protein ENK64_02440 [Flavobacteriales bacterium]|nr:hypothetical protein [Flavobacteriales bacterium]
METILKLQANVKHWWMPVLTGSLLILASLLMIIFPVPTFAGLAILFGWSLFVYGGFNFVFAVRNRHSFKGWIWYLMFGLIEMALGAYLLFQPALAAEALVLYLGFWFTFIGVSRISFSFVMKDMGIKNWGWTLAGGILLLILAFLIILNPILGMFSAVYLVSFAVFLTGLLAISFGWEIKKLNDALTEE